MQDEHLQKKDDPFGIEKALADKSVDMESEDDRDQMLKRFNKDNDMAVEIKADAEGDDKDIQDNKSKLSPLEAYRTKKIKEIKGNVQ